MLVRKRFKYRIYPTKEQQAALAIQFNCARFVYNMGLAARKAHYAEYGKGLNYYDTTYMLTVIKRFIPWLKEANAHVLHASLKDLDRAFKNFFEGRAEHPKFKNKFHAQSIRYRENLSTRGSRIRLSKVGWVRIVLHRPIEGVMKNLTISRTKSGKYFASIQVEQEIDEPTYKGGQIGLDLGLKDFAVTSDGQRFPAPKYLRKSEKRLARLQRRMDKCKGGSNGMEKARLKVARQHERIANQRQDFLHKLSRQLVEENQLIAIEDLHVKGLVKNHNLAKSISDAGWSIFTHQLGYKGSWYGCHIGQVNRFFPSSKRHFVCGHIYEGLTLKERVWLCPGCGELVDRDENASQNILNWYTVGVTEINADGQNVSPTSVGGLVEVGNLSPWGLG